MGPVAASTTMIHGSPSAAEASRGAWVLPLPAMNAMATAAQAAMTAAIENQSPDPLSAFATSLSVQVKVVGAPSTAFGRAAAASTIERPLAANLAIALQDFKKAR